MSRNPERMQYQTDKISYWMCILGIVFNMIYFVGIYSNRSVDPDVAIGTDVLINIIFMMLVFLASEKLKNYAPKWNVYITIIACVQILRIFWVPEHYKKLEMLLDWKYSLAVGCLIASGAVLFLAGINAMINRKILNSANNIKSAEGE